MVHNTINTVPLLNHQLHCAQGLRNIGASQDLLGRKYLENLFNVDACDTMTCGYMIIKMEFLYHLK